VTPRLYVGAALFLAGLGLGGWGAWSVQSWRFAADERDRIEAEAQAQREQAARSDLEAADYLKAQAKADAKETTRTREVLRVIEKPVYRLDCLDADGMRILTEAAADSNARRGLAPALPASEPTE
jgi:hypothetical protein